MTIDNRTTVPESPQFATARVVYYAEEAIALIFALLLVIALRTAPTVESFRNENTKAKAAFRVCLFSIGLSDMLQSSAVFAYVIVGGFGGCELGAILASTGELMSSVLTACLSFEGYLIISQGVRTGEKIRAFIYITFSILVVLTIQLVTGIVWKFGAPPNTPEGNWAWCHLQTQTPASEIISFYGVLIIAIIICSICYLRNELKLRKMLQIQGMNDAIRRTLNRSRLKFLLFPLIFVLSWLPTGIHRIILLSVKDTNTLNDTFHWLLLYVSFVTAGAIPIWNAIFFGWFNPEAREALCSLCRRRSQNRNDWRDGDTRECGLLDDSVNGNGNGNGRDTETETEDHYMRYSFGMYGEDELGDLPPEFVYMNSTRNGIYPGDDEDEDDEDDNNQHRRESSLLQAAVGVDNRW
jgi:hypothetical protein